MLTFWMNCDHITVLGLGFLICKVKTAQTYEEERNIEMNATQGQNCFIHMGEAH